MLNCANTTAKTAATAVTALPSEADEKAEARLCFTVL
jgi:hypothetical protein